MKTFAYKKYQAIRKDYFKMVAKKVSGRRKYTSEYIYHKLAQKYFLAERTIENIIFYRVN